MPRLSHSVPKYRLHRASGKAIVTIAGKDHYLGPWRSTASKVEYDRLIGEWLAAGRPQWQARSVDLTIVEICASYWLFAEKYYTKDGKPTGAIPGIKVALRYLRTHYDHTLATDFGPAALKYLQHKMVADGQSRRYVNDNIDRIRRVFKWAVGETLMPVAIYQSLQAVPNLRKGRTEARELPPVLPVDTTTVEATLVQLGKIPADMVRLQRLTGCRPDEICQIRPMDIDRTNDVWTYCPRSHKTEHHAGRDRVIFIGPRAQEILRPYLLRESTAFCFSPTEADEQFRRAKHLARKTKPSSGSRAGLSVKVATKRRTGERYTSESYRRAIHRACDRAEISRWSPNRLRHAAATEIRKLFGLEASQVVLGHSAADVTQIYAERDMALAARVAREVG